MNPSHTSTGAPASEPEWFVQVDGVEYGPFDAQTLWSYMQEGRVTAQSFVRRGMSGTFRQVANTPALGGWLAHLARPNEANSETTSKSRTCLVMAEIRSGRAMAFLQTLQSLGTVQRIGDTVWLLRCNHDPATLCDVLTGPLRPEDRMFVVDASDADRAAFNLGQAVDQGLGDVFTQDR